MKNDVDCHLTLGLGWASDIEEGNVHIGVMTGITGISKVDLEVIDILIPEFEGSLVLCGLDERACPPTT